MEAIISELSAAGPIGLVAALGILATVVLYRQNQALHKDARDNDRQMLRELFEALSLIRSVTEALRRGGGS